MDGSQAPARPTDVLMSEHRVIERVLTCLATLAERARDSDAFDAEGAARMLDFFVEFADRIHHMKEEDRLFPALESCGLPREAGPTSVMRNEHEIGRARVRAMLTDLDEAAAGPGSARERFVGHALDFVTLLREHIAKEDQVLFPMADSMLPPTTQVDLLSEFERDHALYDADSGPDSYRKLADALCVRFDVTEASAAPSEFQGCCSAGRSAPDTAVSEETCSPSPCSEGQC